MGFLKFPAFCNARRSIPREIVDLFCRNPVKIPFQFTPAGGVSFDRRLRLDVCFDFLT